MHLIKTMTSFMYISTILAIVSTVFVMLTYLFKTKAYGINFNLIDKHITTCRRASLIFTFLVWLANSFEEQSVCLTGYLELSKVCSRFGYTWIVYAFFCIAMCILMISLKKETALIENVSKFRNSGFFMGAVFLIVSFLLNVK